MLTFLLIALGILFFVSQAKGSPKTRSEVEPQVYYQGLQVRVGSGQQTIPREKRLRESHDYWVPPGESCDVGGASIPGGMLYVGKGMHSANGGPDEPGHIDPGLRVSPDHGSVLDSELSYWPSYAQASPTDRRSYLNWLARGRRDPAADISYVFLFYYGLERRLLFDGMHLPRVVAPEVPAILVELEELLGVYGSNGSFSRYCSSLVAWTRTEWDLWGEPRDMQAPDPASLNRYPSDAHRMALARFCATETALPADWALAWLYIHPQVNLRTPARRCPAEFHELFSVRYAERYGEGVVISPPKKRIQLDYHPASRGIDRHQFKRETDLPDVARLKGPINKIIKVAEDVQDELDSFSRWVGKHEDRTSAAAIARLPAPLADERQSAEGKRLKEWLEAALRDGDPAVVATSELLERWPGSADGRVTKGEARVLAEFLERRSIGLEPDPRYGGRNPSALDHVAIFRLQTGDGEPGDMVKGAGLLMQLAATVAAADGAVDEAEERHLEASLEDALALSASDRRRLRAHTARLLADPPGLSGVRAQAQELTVETRKTAARFLIGVAAADGRVTADEITLLRRIYRVLDLDPESVYSEVHALAAGPNDVGPVPVVSPQERASGHAIPPPAPEPKESFTLDLERVERAIRDSHEAAVQLKEIFDDEGSEGDPGFDDEAGDDDVGDDPSSDGGIAGLDAAHSDAVMILSGRESWSRAELTEVAEEHGLMVGGMIETINEAAFAAVDEALLEGKDPVELNAYALEALLQ